MKRLLAFIRGDWGLKILALILAIIIYHELKTETAQIDKHEKRIFQYH